METLKTHPVPSEQAVLPKVELTPDIQVDSLTTAEIDQIITSYEKDFQKPEKEKDPIHEHNRVLAQGIADRIDSLLALTDKDTVQIDNMTIRKRSSQGTLAREYQAVGARVENAASYEVRRTRRMDGYMREETLSLDFANGNTSVGQSTQDKPLGAFGNDLPANRPDGWKGAVWFADGQPDIPDYKNNTQDELKTQRVLELVSGKLTEATDQAHERSNRTKGKRILGLLRIDRVQ